MSLIKRWNNFLLCIKYPIIIPRNLNTNKMCTDLFSCTWLDSLPVGWCKSFGIMFFAELQKAINRYPKEERKAFRIYDIKEKFGKLQVHLSMYTSEIDQILDKYAALSAKTCVACGSKAYWLTKGYVVPMCNKCKKEYKHKYKFISIFKRRKSKWQRRKSL